MKRKAGSIRPMVGQKWDAARMGRINKLLDKDKKPKPVSERKER